MEMLYIVMPAYNEEETICNVIKAWYPLLSGKVEGIIRSLCWSHVC